MTPITKIPLKTEPDAELEALKDSAATQRALDYYLKPTVTQRSTEHKLFTVREGLSLEEAKAQVLAMVDNDTNDIVLQPFKPFFEQSTRGIVR